MGTPLVDIAGRTFGRLTVVSRAANTSTGQTRWYCKCDCGNESVVQACSLQSGRARSCGCLRKEIARKSLTKHGHAVHGKRTHIYDIWTKMRVRWKGSICDRWSTFDSFFADMGECPAGTRLYRIDDNGVFDMANCKWVDSSLRRPYRSRNGAAGNPPTTPCKKMGHLSQRTTSGACVQCTRDRARQQHREIKADPVKWAAYQARMVEYRG